MRRAQGFDGSLAECVDQGSFTVESEEEGLPMSCFGTTWKDEGWKASAGFELLGHDELAMEDDIHQNRC